MLECLLSPADSLKVKCVLDQLETCGLTFAVTGGLAIAARLREVDAPVRAKALNDLDLVVGAWSAFQGCSWPAGYLINHVHPSAPEGKLLLQLVSPEHRLRIDVFRQYGLTLSRAAPLPLILDSRILSVEDLRARVTAHVCRSLGRGVVIDRKHVESFGALSTAGEPRRLVEAWRDHRETVDGTILEATLTAQELIKANPHLIVTEQYGVESVPCAKCKHNDRFRLADRALIASILGYT
jgi:hypothetical protein